MSFATIHKGRGTTGSPSLPPHKKRPSTKSLVPALIAAALAVSLSLPGLSSSVQAAPGDPLPYQNTSLPFNVRAADLVSRMTLEEKIDQLRAAQVTQTDPTRIDRLDVPAYAYWGEANHSLYRPTLPVTLAGGDYSQWPQSTSLATTWNTELMNRVAGGIADEARVTYNTVCPPGNDHVNVVNPSQHACYGLNYWSPNQNLNRDPRWGRADESYTEDPILTGNIASSFVEGLQGNHHSSQPDTIAGGPETYVQAMATPKHYLANNSEGNRDYGTSNISERAMHEYFLVPFSMSAGHGGSRALMSSYNALGYQEDYTGEYPAPSTFDTAWSPNDRVAGTTGTPSAGSRYSLETMMRRSFGFNGFVTSDCGAITRVWQTGTQGHTWSPVQIGERITQPLGDAWAMKAGTDLDCSGADYPSANGLSVAQSAGYVSESDIDIALVRAFTARFQTGEFDPVASVPWNDVSYSISAAGNPDVKLGSPAHRAVAHEAALEAPVLLKNTGTLPLQSGKTVAVGDAQIINTFQSGSYSIATNMTAVTTTFAQALITRLGGPDNAMASSTSTLQYIDPNVAVFSQGVPSGSTVLAPLTTCASSPCDPVTDANTAEYQISQAANVLVVAGQTNTDGREGTDRTTMDMSRGQAEFIRDSVVPLAQKYNKPISVWIQAKVMVTIAPFKNEVGAITWSSFGGMYQGKAMTELVYNDTVTLEDGRQMVANFSGRMPMTWYSDVDTQLGVTATIGDATAPAVQDYRMTKAEGAPCGRTYLYYQAGTPGCDAPDYAFGHGLSYSSFTYGAPTLSSSSITPDQPVTVSVEVSNTTASHPGKAVVEVYAKAPTGANGDQYPIKQLKGFAKTGVLTSSPETVQITLDAGDFWFWDDSTHAKVFPTGAWTIMAGPSSADADLKSATLNVTGQRTPGVEVVAALPDGTELSLDTPDNRINAQLSVTKHDMSFWDLTDPALTVAYSSSDPTVATVDSNGVVSAVSVGTVLITATATANGETGSTDFPVVVTSGVPDATGTAFANNHTSRVNFGDVKVHLEDTTEGVQLSANIVPAAAGTTYAYQIAPMDTNTAGAAITSDGILTASQAGHVRVTVTATSGDVMTSESALIRITPTVDKTELQQAVDAAKALGAGSYTTSSWAAAGLAEGIAAAQAVLDNADATQAEVDAATAQLADVVAKLVPRGNPAVLQALISASDSLNGKLDSFTDDSVRAFSLAVNAAKAVMTDAADKTQAELDAAVANLQTAINGLTVKSADKTVLQAVYNSASGLSNADGTYTAESWAALQAKIQAAKAVLDAPGSTKAQIDAAVTDIVAAMADLVVVVQTPPPTEPPTGTPTGTPPVAPPAGPAVTTGGTVQPSDHSGLLVLLLPGIVASAAVIRRHVAHTR